MTIEDAGANEEADASGGVSVDAAFARPAIADGSIAVLSDAAGSAPPPDPAAASSYLINPAHTNAVTASTLRPPLTRLWSTTLTGTASYPLIANGLVFVTSATASTAGGTLTAGASIRALDASNGSLVWSAPIAGGFGAAAYDGGRVFTVDGAGAVTAYDAATGVVEWSKSMVGSLTWSFDTVPTAYRGVLYTSASGDGGTLFAYDERRAPCSSRTSTCRAATKARRPSPTTVWSSPTAASRPTSWTVSRAPPSGTTRRAAAVAEATSPSSPETSST